MKSLNQIYNEDCLQGMQDIFDGSVDLIICDLPYGTTKCAWDVVIPFEELWKQYHRIIKKNGAIVLFGQEPFSTVLRMSNLNEYKYDWYWVKEAPTNIFQMKRRLGKVVETISVFYSEQPTYNQQRTVHDGPRVSNKIKGEVSFLIGGETKTKLKEYQDDGTRCPTQILKFNRVSKRKVLHPTQKPVELIEYLIKTYTNEGETVLDNCMGSGTTAVACINTSRNYIGFETSKEYFDISQKRIKDIVSGSRPNV